MKVLTFQFAATTSGYSWTVPQDSVLYGIASSDSIGLVSRDPSLTSADLTAVGPGNPRIFYDVIATSKSPAGIQVTLHKGDKLYLCAAQGTFTQLYLDDADTIEQLK